jgi:hypothetical protein
MNIIWTKTSTLNTHLQKDIANCNTYVFNRAHSELAISPIPPHCSYARVTIKSQLRKIYLSKVVRKAQAPSMVLLWPHLAVK